MIQRKYTRFCCGESVFARPRIDNVTMGKVKDISMGGMAFEYISNDEAIRDDFTCDLFTIDGHLCIVGMPCKIVYRAFIASTVIKDNVTLRICKYGVFFNGMDARRQGKLQELIGKLS